MAALVHEKYPEVNLEIFSYSGANTTQYLQNMLAADDLPDICTQTVYDPNINDMPGMNAHVSKPVEMKVLEKTIRSIKSGGGGVPNRRSLNSDKWKVTRHKKIEKDN